MAYQGRKRAKTSHILPITDKGGYIVASTEIIAGNHNDAYELKPYLPGAFRAMKRVGLSIAGAFFNADSAFVTCDARNVCFNHHRIPNITNTKRNRQSITLGRKRLFNPTVYKDRFASRRSFAWIDQLRALLMPLDLKKIYFMGSLFLAFALFNLRNVLS